MKQTELEKLLKNKISEAFKAYAGALVRPSNVYDSREFALEEDGIKIECELTFKIKTTKK